MSWIQITFVVDAKLVEPLSDLLEGLLAQAVTTQNAGKDEFYEVAFPGTPEWQKVAVTALFNEGVDGEAVVDFVYKQFQQNADDEIPTKIEMLQDQDWERVWLSNFKPVEVGDKLWVCPSWCEPKDPTARNLILDPGLAFGTGTHATTAMCLDWISRQNLKNKAVLDYGSGSGILAIAAIMSGAEQAYAADIDPLAVTAASDNAELNQVQDSLVACLPNEMPLNQFPLVIANILADVIIELREVLLSHLELGGTLVLTGILTEQSDRVQQAFGAEFDFDQTLQEHWCMLVGRRRS